MQADFRPSPLAASAAITSVKLVERNGIHVLFAEREGRRGASLFHAVLDAGTTSRDPMGPLSPMMPKPGWDVAPGMGQAFSVVVTVPGSAVSDLELISTSGGNAVTVNRHNPFGVFGAPHFIKGAPGPISSVAIIDDKTLIVLFPLEADGGFGAYRALEPPAQGVLQDARLVRSGTGYLLFTKTIATGAADSARRSPSGETTRAGMIHCMRLDADFKSLGPATRPLGDQLILEFDAAAHDDDAVVFAATAKGYVLARGDLTNGAFDPASRAEHVHALPLSSPSILAAGSKLHLAAIESEGTPEGRIVTATVP